MSTQIHALYTLRKSDLGKVGAVLEAAFRRDPVWKKVFAGGWTVEQKRWIFEIPVRYCLMYGEAYAPSEKLEGIAAWTPGRFADLTVWRLFRSGAAWFGMKIGLRFAARLVGILIPFNRRIRRDRRAHMQGTPFLYLQILGVAPDFQGRGFGGRLLDGVIQKSDREKLPLYLETETEPNVRMYEKRGFRVLKKISLPGLGLPVWEMVREPR